MRAFEIHTYQDGKWKIDSVFDDRELALFEARRVDQGSRYSGVRVVEENYDEGTALTTTKTIFRGGNVDRVERARKAAQAHRPRAGGTQGSREPARKRRARKKSNPTNLVIPVIILCILVLAGLAALFGLQQLSQLR